ncbi:MAG: hypothetical protein F9K18_02090 [Thermoanaerobaculia bacterium]|nr:MAG: hypothetical protein F9K18_02090 [Thermoanaerobaculia bacterium]
MRISIPLLLAVALGSGGCAEPVLDGRDLDGSIADVRDSLDATQRGAFEVAADLVRRASAGEIEGTQAFSLDGMSAAAVFAEAERIEIRRDKAFEEASALAHWEILAADEKLARLRVVEFVARPIGDARMTADVTVHNGLEFAVDTAWLSVEVGVPGGPAAGGEEFVSFQPPLRRGEQRTIRLQLIGDEARSLPVTPPAVLRTRFVLVERGGEVALKSPTPEESRRAEAAIATSEKRVRELDARLAALQTPK